MRLPYLASLLSLACLAAPAAHAAIVYDLPGSSIVYGHNFQNSSYRAAGSFQSNASGAPLSSVTWYVRVDGNWAAGNPGSNPLVVTDLDLALYTNNGGTNTPDTLVANLGSISLSGLQASDGMQPFTLSGLSTALLPSTYYWIVGSSTNAAAGSIEIGLYANVSPFPTTPAFTAYNTLGALLSTDGGTNWQGGAQSGYGYFFAGQVQVPESSSSLPLVGLSSALLGFLALRRRR
ncbi:MAG: hypothetical protein B9S27_02375 [Opitutia bacterium Tous-C8FEB]|nr:MAG: hypothetical protein B9S27_02375 [Opitutae bacterium Tous-C8FEB]